MTDCPVCASAAIQIFDRRPRVSILQNRLYDTADAARHALSGELAMAACGRCSFVWNAAFDPTLMVYDPSYENDQSQSEVFRGHLSERVSVVLESFARSPGAHVVEVGCGQGDFMQRLEIAGNFGSLTGFDPAWRGNDGEGPGRTRIRRALFTRETAAELPAPPDAVISRHTIEHISDPVAFLKAIREASGERPVRIFLETPCAHWILKNLQAQDFFYEHCSIFTTVSLYYAMTAAGMVPTRIAPTFSGQYLWAEADPDQQPLAAPAALELDVGRWETERARFIDQWRARITKAAEDGPVYVWGVGAKGVTFGLLVDPDGTRLAGAVDVNPKKQGKHVPLTGLKVIAPVDLPAVPFTAIVMNPNYTAEIAGMLRDGSRTATLLPITGMAI